MNSILSDYNKPGYIAEPVAGNVYVDVSYTFIHPATNDILVSSDIDAIKNSIKNIVLTPIGTRPFAPNFGTRVGNLLFELADGGTATLIKNEILEGITKYEKRVSNVVVAVADNSDRNAYDITIGFTMIYGGTAELQFILNRTR
jgi:phage baseplate assembly protein W